MWWSGDAYGALDVEAEPPPGQMLAQDGLTAGLAPEMAEHQIQADAAAAQFRQVAAVPPTDDDPAGSAAVLALIHRSSADITASW